MKKKEVKKPYLKKKPYFRCHKQTILIDLKWKKLKADKEYYVFVLDDLELMDCIVDGYLRFEIPEEHFIPSP